MPSINMPRLGGYSCHAVGCVDETFSCVLPATCAVGLCDDDKDNSSSKKKKKTTAAAATTTTTNGTTNFVMLMMA